MIDFKKIDVIAEIISKNKIGVKLSDEEDLVLTEWMQQDDENRLLFARLDKVLDPNSEENKDLNRVNPDDILNGVKLKINSNLRAARRRYIYITVASIASIFAGLYFGLNSEVQTNDYSETITVKGGDVFLLKEDDNLVNIKQRQAKDIITLNEEDQVIEFKNSKDKIVKNTLIVPNGESINIILPDGSKVWINAGSKIIFPSNFAKDKREVEFSGEAYFDIETDANRPFIVNTKNVETKVLGTEFLITAYENSKNTHVSLVEGAIEVKSEICENYMNITPGHKFIYNEENKYVTKESFNIKNALAVKNDIFMFWGVSIEDITIILSHWYNKQFIFENDAIKNVKLYFKADKTLDIYEILELMSKTNKLKYNLDNDTIYLK